MLRDSDERTLSSHIKPLQVFFYRKLQTRSFNSTGAQTHADFFRKGTVHFTIQDQYRGGTYGNCVIFFIFITGYMYIT